MTVDLPDPLFDELRDEGWRIARTEAGEAWVVVMPHVSREQLEEFLRTLDRLAGTVGV